MDTMQLISETKVKCITNQKATFIFNLLCRVGIEVTDRVPTAAADAEHLMVNPKFFESLTLDERVFLLGHEIMHYALMHPLRMKGLDHKVYNYAADYYINGQLVAMGLTMPKDGLYDRKYDGLSTEEIYTILMQNPPTEEPPQMGMDIVAGYGSPDKESSDAEGSGSTKTLEEAQQAIEEIVMQAAMQAEMSGHAGSIPQDIQRHLANLRKPKVLWKPILHRFLLDVQKADYAYNKPNRRWLPQDLIMPSLHSEALSTVDFAIDVSGSITDEQFAQFVSEVHSVFRQLKPKSINVMQFDHALSGFDTVKSLRDIEKIKFTGGGGTQPNVALERTKTTGAKAIIILTDGYFSMDLVNPNKPVVWIVFDNKKFKPPFGKVIEYKLDA